MTKARKTGGTAYRTIGTTAEGIAILKPKTKPTHFTTGQIRSSIAQVLRREAGLAGSGKTPRK